MINSEEYYEMQFGGSIQLLLQLHFNNEDLSESTVVVSSKTGDKTELVAQYSDMTGPIIRDDYANKYFLQNLQAFASGNCVSPLARCLMKRFVYSIKKDDLSRETKQTDVREDGFHLIFDFSQDPRDTRIRAFDDTGKPLFIYHAGGNNNAPFTILKNFDLDKITRTLEKFCNNANVKISLAATDVLSYLPQSQQSLDGLIYSQTQEALHQDEAKYWQGVAKEMNLPPPLFNWRLN